MKKDSSPSRQLAAIMFTDIVGYTKLMGENEDKAFHILAKNKAIQKPMVQKYNGRWLKEIGDGTLSSFNSALDAVYCANKIMKCLNDDPEISVRIGIHIGDVTFSAGDVYGDGVNIASRLEEYAQPNEILISDVVYKNIKNIEGIKVEFLKETDFKNVDELIRIYRISEEITEHTPGVLPSLSELTDIKKRSPRKTILFLLVLIPLLFLAYLLIFNRALILNSFNSTPLNKTVAVMQFENLGGQEERAYSIGITEDIIVQLTKIHELEVIQQPRNFSIDLEGKSYKEIGSELGVAHLLLGSVWKNGDQLRVSASLIDTRTDGVLWSNTWNESLDDIFAIYSEVAISIAEKLKAEITSEEVAQIEKRPTTNMNAYDLYLKGREYYSKYNEQDNHKARELFNEALELDPDLILAHAGLSDVFSQLAQRSHMKELWLDSAFYHASIVTQKEPGLSNGHKSLGLYYVITGDTQKASEEFLKAINIDNNVEAVINLSRIYYRTGQMDKSLRILNNARSLYPLNENILFNYGATYYRLNDFQNANEYIDQALLIDPGHINSLLLKWFIAVITGDDNNSYATASRLSYFANDKIGDALVLLQNKINNNIGNTETAARTLRNYLDDREFDYVDIPYLYNLISQIYYEGGMKERAKGLLDYKIIYNKSRIEMGEMSYKFYYELAQIYAITAEKEEAYHYLELSLEHGWPEYLFGQIDPAFRSISDEKRFQDLIERARQNLDEIHNKVSNLQNVSVG